MTSMQLAASILVAALCACRLQLADAHAYLLYPESRNYQAYTIPPPESRYYCPHCGQGGGAGHIPSMCGDPFQDVVGNAAFTPFTQRFYRYTNLTQGQTLKIQITVSTNHGGRMSLSICPLSKNQVTQDCFNQPQYQLRRVNSDPKYNNKRYWYLSAANMVSAEETFKLLANINCPNGCMIQWWWVGYQSCVLPCQDTTTDDVPGECATNPMNPGVSPCTSILQTEQFYNCGDVIIAASGPIAPSPPSPKPPPPAPSPRPSPSSPKPPPPVPSPRPFPPSPKPPPPAPSPRPTPPSPKPPPPVPSPRPSPPSPSPASVGTCPGSSDYRCTACSTAAASNTAAAPTSLVGACFSCSVTAPAAQSSSCTQCMGASASKDVISGCLSCVSKGLPGWSCVQLCAQPASSGTQMAACTTCLATPNVNTWGCQNCLQLAKGDATKSSQCFTCVQAGKDPWTCGQCLSKSNYAACYTCLSTASSSNAGACIA